MPEEHGIRDADAIVDCEFLYQPRDLRLPIHPLPGGVVTPTRRCHE